MLQNPFVTVCGIRHEDLGKNCEDTKSAHFEQKAWAIAHAFENVGFW